MSLLDNIINSKIVSGLLDRRRPLVDANPLQGFYDSAPAGSVMAPGGLLANPMSMPIGSTPGATQDMLGLLSFAPVIGDAAGLAADAQMYANQPETRTMGNYALTALGALPFVPSVAGATVFHGSPHKFDAFDMSKIGTGEGAQAYGHGLYFAENRDVAKDYQFTTANRDDYGTFNGLPIYDAYKQMQRKADKAPIAEAQDLYERMAFIEDLGLVHNYDDALARIDDDSVKEWALSMRDKYRAPGNLYTVDIPDSDIDKMLDWDAPLSEQPEGVREAIEAWAKGQDRTTQIHLLDSSGRIEGDATGRYVLDVMASGREAGSAEKELKSMGIPGIKYFDGDSRAAGEGTRNYVVFDDQLPRILERNGEKLGLLDPADALKRADEQGYIDAYHGANRLDRLLSKPGLDPKRATSGPMPFFSDDPAIASSYSTKKSDTSMAGDHDGYEDWFKYQPKGARKEVNLDQIWPRLSSEERKTLTENLGDIGFIDDDYTSVGRNADNVGGSSHSHWEYLLKENKGNALAAAKELWLNSGNLFDNEEMFLKVLQEAGLPGVRYDSPHLSYEGVLPAKLRITNPFETTPENIRSVLPALENAAKRKRGKAGYGADMWDKRYVSGAEWISRLKDDLANDTTHAWTTIPDWVTDTLRAEGFDGIKDIGGKHGGGGHNVYIPFDANQVRSRFAMFDPAKKDSANLLASIPALGFGGLLGASLYEPDSAGAGGI